MSWFSKISCFNETNAQVEWVGPDVEDFSAAGVFFHNNIHTLGGYQPHKQSPYVSGIGGSRETGEDYFTTAIRECIEELFHLRVTDMSVITRIRIHVHPRRVLDLKGYVILVYTFTDLQAMINILYNCGMISPLYDKKPTCIEDLVFKRKVNPDAEISHLVVLPFIKHRDSGNYMDREFLRDIRAIFSETNNHRCP